MVDFRFRKLYFDLYLVCKNSDSWVGVDAFKMDPFKPLPKKDLI